ncbi:MAG TPA: hypothetical protein V6C57_07520 [Coleofasciculaceae cyanobacterium]
MVDDKYREGEAIAQRARQQLGATWLISYHGQRDRWEIKNVLEKDLVFGSYQHTEEGWKYRPNPSIPRGVKGAVDFALDTAMKAIATQQEAK